MTSYLLDELLDLVHQTITFFLINWKYYF